MKKMIKYSLMLIMALVTFTACDKSFNEVANENPNQPTAVPASLLFNNIDNALVVTPFSSYYVGNGNEERWDQYYLYNYNYYGSDDYNWGSGTDYYPTLTNAVKMQQEALAAGLPTVNPYDALAKFFKAYFFSLMSLEMGDIPMSQALQGTNALTPKFDTQKSVFQQTFALLDSANAEFATLITNNNTSLAGDIYFANNLTEWQKVVNTLELRLLVQLNVKVAEGSDTSGLQIFSRLSRILNNPATYPIMTSNADNLQFNYLYPTNEYPNNPNNFGNYENRTNCSATYINLDTTLHDPRLFVTSEPAQQLIDSLNCDSTSFKAFRGANPGEDEGTMNAQAGAGYFSLSNRYRYWRTYTGEPTLMISYPEMCFNIAEAINRGWVAGMTAANAETYYINGIQASRATYSIPLTGTMPVYFFKAGSPAYRCQSI